MPSFTMKIAEDGPAECSVVWNEPKQRWLLTVKQRYSNGAVVAKQRPMADAEQAQLQAAIDGIRATVTEDDVLRAAGVSVSKK